MSDYAVVAGRQTSELVELRAERDRLARENAALRAVVENIADMAEMPTYRSLEVGFRHLPLTRKEIVERYGETCLFIAQDARAALASEQRT